MKKFTLLPVLLLATISLHGMASRFAQTGRQLAPTLRSKLSAQPMRLPATMPKGCPPGMRLLSSSSRSQGGYGYASAQQHTTFGGREALLLGGAALAGKTVYDYWNTPEGRALNRAYAHTNTNEMAEDYKYAIESDQELGSPVVFQPQKIDPKQAIECNLEQKIWQMVLQAQSEGDKINLDIIWWLHHPAQMFFMIVNSTKRKAQNNPEILPNIFQRIADYIVFFAAKGGMYAIRDIVHEFPQSRPIIEEAIDNQIVDLANNITAAESRRGFLLETPQLQPVISLAIVNNIELIDKTEIGHDFLHELLIQNGNTAQIIMQELNRNFHNLTDRQKHGMLASLARAYNNNVTFKNFIDSQKGRFIFGSTYQFVSKIQSAAR